MGAAIATALAFAQPASAQSAPAHSHPHASPAATATPGEGMSEDMMGKCREHHAHMMSLMQQMSTTLEQAKKSNDPAKMRAAIEQTERMMAQMRSEMHACMQMMDHEGMDHEGMDHDGMMPGGKMSPGMKHPGASPRPMPGMSP